MKKKVSIIASFRNEEKSISEFIDRINNSFKKRKHIDYELIFIDDFSSFGKPSIKIPEYDKIIDTNNK